MTDETKNEQMPDQASRKGSGGSATFGAQPKAPASSFPVGDPTRRDFGDRTDDESRKLNPTDCDTDDDTKGARSEDRSNDDAGEGHKGPRVEAKTGSSDDRTQRDRTDSGQDRNDKSKSMRGDGKSGSQSGASTKDSGGKSARTQGGGFGQ